MYAVAASRRVYVDPVNGSPTAKGTEAAPVTSIGTAASLLGTIRGVPGIILVKGTEAAPYTGAVSIPATVTKDITIAPWGSRRLIMHVTTSSAAFKSLSLSKVTLLRTVVISSGTTGIRLGDTGLSGGTITAYDCYAEGTTQGWQTVGVWTALNLHRCQGKGGSNDGFNIHGDVGVHGVATLYDCWADGCGDEGCSPHDDVTMNVYGGRWTNNAGGGMNAVGNAVCNIYKSLADGSRAMFTGNGHDLTTDGIGYSGNASGVIDGATSTGSHGVDFSNTGTGTVTRTDLVTGDGT